MSPSSSFSPLPSPPHPSPQVAFDLKSKMVSLKERDVAVRGRMEDPSVGACLLGNCMDERGVNSEGVKRVFMLSVPGVLPHRVIAPQQVRSDIIYHYLSLLIIIEYCSLLRRCYWTETPFFDLQSCPTYCIRTLHMYFISYYYFLLLLSFHSNKDFSSRFCSLILFRLISSHSFSLFPTIPHCPHMTGLLTRAAAPTAATAAVHSVAEDLLLPCGGCDAGDGQDNPFTEGA